MNNDYNKPIHLGNIYGKQFGTGYAGNVWSTKGICPTLMTMQGGNKQPLVITLKPNNNTKEVLTT